MLRCNVKDETLGSYKRIMNTNVHFGCKNHINQKQMLSDCSVRSVLSGDAKMNKINLTTEELNSNWRWETMSRLIYSADELRKVWGKSESLGFNAILCFSFLLSIHSAGHHQLTVTT